jgi:hypothetical protein
VHLGLFDGSYFCPSFQPRLAFVTRCRIKIEISKLKEHGVKLTSSFNYCRVDSRGHQSRAEHVMVCQLKVGTLNFILLSKLYPIPCPLSYPTCVEVLWYSVQRDKEGYIHLYFRDSEIPASVALATAG